MISIVDIILAVIIIFYIFICPYTKVEERLFLHKFSLSFHNISYIFKLALIYKLSTIHWNTRGISLRILISPDMTITNFLEWSLEHLLVLFAFNLNLILCDFDVVFLQQAQYQLHFLPNHFMSFFIHLVAVNIFCYFFAE